VQQPWAWALVHGGKTVENRSQAWSYRGPLAIHAGQRLDRAALGQVDWLTHWAMPDVDDLVGGAIIGVVDLVDVHVSHAPDETWTAPQQAECCISPWAQFADPGAKPVVHLVVENPRPIAQPIPCKGRLGLWTPAPEVLAELEAAPE